MPNTPKDPGEQPEIPDHDRHTGSKRIKTTASLPDSPIAIAKTIHTLRARVKQWRQQGLTIALIPTMGALHAGHLSLIAKGRELADRTIASIFVNPTQFGENEDLDAYPRTLDQDLAQLTAAGCDLAFVPTAREMYPEGFQTSISVNDISTALCGHSRPVHFGGVATIVCKLLNQAQPDFAVFGEKDFQQLLVIKRLVKDLDMDVKIVGGATMREDDGLAMSSRNAYLSTEQRAIAGTLNKTLQQMANQLQAGAAPDKTAEEGKQALVAAGFDEIDYLEVRTHDLDLATKDNADKPWRIFAAAYLGTTRLIDNWPVDR